jgi:hypothetical protein
MESLFVFALVVWSWLQFAVVFPVITLSDFVRSWSSASVILMSSVIAFEVIEDDSQVTKR